MDMRNDLAKARDAWIESDEAQPCLTGTAAEQYLRNRLIQAFIAGWNAKEEAERSTPEKAE